MVRMKKWWIFPGKLIFHFLILDDEIRCLANLTSGREAMTMSYAIN